MGYEKYIICTSSLIYSAQIDNLCARYISTFLQMTFSQEVLGSDSLTQGILKSGKDPLQAQFSEHRGSHLSSVAARSCIEKKI